MQSYILQEEINDSDIAIIPVTAKSYDSWLAGRDSREQNLLQTRNFQPEPGKYSLITKEDGTLAYVLLGIDGEKDIWNWSVLPAKLRDTQRYYIDNSVEAVDMHSAALGWQLACYRYDRYTQKPSDLPQLVIPKQTDITLARNLADAICLTRDLINAPTNDMGPSELAAEIKRVGDELGATYHEIVGDELLKQNYPTIHAVGRACDDAPRLLTLEWGDRSHPALTLVGKGVCFDTGGLNIKPDKSMGLMKKDMGGAGFMLGLTQLIIQQNLKVHLKLYIPAVENSISGNAYRPQDVIKSRKGITIEISNTDAEGRLILCDALADADDAKPDLLIDAATLTGAARVATGTEIPAFFTNDDAIANEINVHTKLSNELLWQLPLWDDYRYMLNSDVADIDHAASSGYAGAITAALFLKEFVTQTKSWIHIDMMAWNVRARPGRPKGGEAQGMRALYSMLEARYGKA